MLKVLQMISNQNAGIITALFIFFAFVFTASGESAQNKNAAKTKAAASKKNAKTAPTPNKKAQAKATPTPKKSIDKKDKKDSSSKNKAADKARQTPSKKTSASKPEKSDRKNSAKNAKETRDSKSKETAKNSRADEAKNKRSARRNERRRDTNDANSRESRTGETSNRNSGKSVRAKQTVEKQKVVVEQTNTADKELPQIIVTDVAARVRSQAQANAPEMSRLRLGTILKVTEKNPAWYKVQYLSGGKTANGWISANSVNDLNAGAKAEIYRQIADRNYKSEMDFAAAAELADFLAEADAETSSAELEYKRLLALRVALKKIPAGQSVQTPYKEFLKAHEKSVVYSDPAGEWYVASNKFWDLRKKHADAAIGDEIAWEAAQNPLPGECEGYVNCYLFAQRMTYGEYLRLYPNGAKSADALKNLTAYLEPLVADSAPKTVYNGPTDVTDRAEFNNLIAELRTIISRLTLNEKEKPLQQLKHLAEAFR